MKQSISLYDFINDERLTCNFSYDALVALFDYFEDYEESNGVEMDYDPIAIRCEFSEYENLKEACMANLSPDDRFINYATESEMMDYLQDNTTVIELNNCSRIILQDF